jgi:hypothetical protein
LPYLAQRKYNWGTFSDLQRQEPGEFGELGRSGGAFNAGRISMYRFSTAAGLWMLGVALAIWAADAAAQTPPANPSGSGVSLRLYLMEGSVVSGRLAVSHLQVETKFGTLSVPVDSIVSFTPGLNAHPELRQRIQQLIQQLGSNLAQQRDDAERELANMGLAVRAQLEAHLQDEDAERRTRVQKLLDELQDLETEEDLLDAPQELIDDDMVETTLFTMVGRISPQSFTVQTKFGELNVALSNIRRAERESADKPDLRRSVSVLGDNLAGFNWKNSGIKVNRGDEVSIVADGRVIMTPWGNNQFSTPDGSPNFQWYLPNKIPGGALCAKIGAGEEPFKLGSRSTFVAKKSGILYLGVGMNPQFANQGYSFPGEYQVRIRIRPQ